MNSSSQAGARKPKLSAAGNIVAPPLPPRRRGAPPPLPPRIPAVPNSSPPPKLHRRAEYSINSIDDISLGLYNLHTNQDDVPPVRAQAQPAKQHPTSPYVTE